MSQHSPHQGESQNLLTQIYEGMTVYDPEGAKIGTVKHVHFDDAREEADELGLGPATISDPGLSETSLLESFAKAIAPSQAVPEELRQRLLRCGFIKIDCAGVLTSDRYAIADQIAHVSEDWVTLETSRDTLLKG